MGTWHTDRLAWVEKKDDFAATYGDFEFLMFYENLQIFLHIYLARVHLRRSNKVWLKCSFGAVRRKKK